MTRRAALSPGDVLAADRPSGTILFQFIGTYPKYGDAILVCPAVQARGVTLSPDLFSDGYVVLSPTARPLKERLARVVGHIAPAPLPTRLRRETLVPGRWIVEDSSGEKVVKTGLSADELRIPALEIVPLEFVVRAVEEGVRPDREPGVIQLSAELERRHDSPRSRGEVTHYLYFRDAGAAERAEATLTARHFRTLRDLDESRNGWFVRAKHVPRNDAEAYEAELAMAALAEELDGEYDGNEVDLGER